MAAQLVILPAGFASRSYLSALLQHQHGVVRRTNDFVRHATEQHASEPASAVGADNDHRAGNLIAVFDDASGCVADRHMCTCFCTQCFGHFHELRQVLLSISCLPGIR